MSEFFLRSRLAILRRRFRVALESIEDDAKAQKTIAHRQSEFTFGEGV